MRLIHGLLYWFSAHCWGCWFGAKWRYRQHPTSANPVFVSGSFLRFCLLLVTVDGLEGIALYSAGFHWSMGAAALIGAACGLATGLAHGRDEYSPF